MLNDVENIYFIAVTPGHSSLIMQVDSVDISGTAYNADDKHILSA